MEQIKSREQKEPIPPFPENRRGRLPAKDESQKPHPCKNQRRKDGQPYNVKKGGSSNFQSSAEACAKHLKNWLQHTGK